MPITTTKISLPTIMASTDPRVRLRAITHGTNSYGNQEIKEWQDRETRRWTTTLNELRAKLEREKHEALTAQKDAMNRSFRKQLTKLVKEKEDILRKQQMEWKSEVSKTNCCNELQKFVQENATLRKEKKKLEDNLQVLKESDQNRYIHLRSLLDEKTTELTCAHKQAHQEIVRLREETKTKDRVISHLEVELRVQAGRAEQFRHILEKSVASTTNHRTQLNNNEREELLARERKLQIRLSDLEDKMRQQQENFSHEKRDLQRRLNDVELEQAPLRQKNKQYLTRNVELAAKNRQLEEAVKIMQQQCDTRSNLKRSLTRPNLNRIGTPPKNDKQRRMEYVQQIQKLRKEQRYYSMWELPPLLEVDTDSAADISDTSEGSLSPGTSSGVPSSCSDSWNEDTRRELEILFTQLSREHADLQRSYQILHEKLRQLTSFTDSDTEKVNYATLQADYNAAKTRIRNLEEILELKQNNEEIKHHKVPSLLEIQAKFVREKLAMDTQIGILTHRLQESQKKCTGIQAELNEARDQNELLEFRILELEECQERASSSCSVSRDRKDVCTDTDSDDLSVGDSGVTSLTSFPNADCSSPTPSIHAVQDGDFLNDKICTVKQELQEIVLALNDPSQKAILTQLQALLGVCQTRLTHCNKGNDTTVIDTTWGWHLQESGIFEEETSVDASIQTEPIIYEQPIQHGDVSVTVTIPLRSADEENLKSHTNSQVQSITNDANVVMQEEKGAQVELGAFSHDMSVQVDGMCTEEQRVQRPDNTSLNNALSEDKAIDAICQMADITAQTEEQMITLNDFRDLEEYYLNQIEILQKEKVNARKNLQDGREEMSQLVHQIDAIARQLAQTQENNAHLENALLTQRGFYEKELESAYNSSKSELAMSKECLQLIWHEIKDYIAVSDIDNQSVMELTKSLITSIQVLCNELGKLRSKVVELAEMEQAFQTTLQQADGLVYHIEEQHLQRIRELEQSEQDLKSQLEQLQKQILNLSTYSAEGTEVLEARVKELEAENEAANSQLIRLQELQDYCQHLRNRVDELEQLESQFKQAVLETEKRFSSREQRYRNEMDLMQNEIEKCRESESKWQQHAEQKELQISHLRLQLDDEQKVIVKLETDIKELQTKLAKDDTSFRNEVTKLRIQLNVSLTQLNELEAMNCQLREQIDQHQKKIIDLQRSLEEENARCQDLSAENYKLVQLQNEMQHRTDIPVIAKPLTEELFEAELDSRTTLDDFSVISIPTTPTVLEGCTDVFEEHFKVLESLETYLESQNRAIEVGDRIKIDDPSLCHEDGKVTLLQVQLDQLRNENLALQNSLVKGQTKDEIIHILVNQLKARAHQESLTETANIIRQLAANGEHQFYEEVANVCQRLEIPVERVTTETLKRTEPIEIVQKNVSKPLTVLPEEDPFLSPASDFRVTRKVGQDGLVVAWVPSCDSFCAGYLICVNGEEAQRVRSAHRTKAVLSGLDLQHEMNIRIYSLSPDGSISLPAETIYLPDNIIHNEMCETKAEVSRTSQASEIELSNESVSELEVPSPREVVVQTFYTNSSVTVRSSRRVSSTIGSRIPVRASVP